MEKYALITGASRGIGRAIALHLASDGYNIIINYRSGAEAAQEVKAAVETIGRNAVLMPFDVCDAQLATESISQWMTDNKENPIEVVVNNAGIRLDNVMAMMDSASWHKVIATTLDGFFNVTQPILKKMQRARYGRVINMTSVSGMMGLPGQTNYSAAKAALIGATKALAKEVAPRGITVNAVAPGFIETDMTDGLNQEELSKTIPAGRFGTAEEVANLVSFLASAGASYITGQVISINGGLYA